MYNYIYCFSLSLPSASHELRHKPVAAETEEQVAENVGTHSDTSMKVVTLRM